MCQIYQQMYHPFSPQEAYTHRGDSEDLSVNPNLGDSLLIYDSSNSGTLQFDWWLLHIRN